MRANDRVAEDVRGFGSSACDQFNGYAAQHPPLLGQIVDINRAMDAHGMCRYR
jgi:hypothetical protein